MDKTTYDEIRSLYLGYFEKHNHIMMPSSSLVPQDDGLLFTNSGMYQFKPYFTKEKKLDDGIGITTCQKCLRTGDLDEVGDESHLTFFEMLGNFSFGQLEREEMCQLGWDFSVRILGLDPDRIWISVHEDDVTTSRIWKEIGISENHIVSLGDDDNFWSVGDSGPCGYCTEMYYDMQDGCEDLQCRPGCQCNRFLEYWNIVFTSHEKLSDGSIRPLPGNGNIDTGMGLERVCGILDGYGCVYGTGLLEHLMSKLSELTDDKISEQDKRIISDHIRSICFVIGDGVLPSNNGRGYVLRKLIRRVYMVDRRNGINNDHLDILVDDIIDSYDNVYDLSRRRTRIHEILKSEIRRFDKTIDRGVKVLRNKVKTDSIIRGDTVFKMSDTYGIPKEITLELCRQMNVIVCDMYLYDLVKEQQRNRGGTNNRW